MSRLTYDIKYASADRPSTVQLFPNVMYASADGDHHACVDRNGPIYVGGNTNIADAGANIIYAVPLNDEDLAAAVQRQRATTSTMQARHAGTATDDQTILQPHPPHNFKIQ